MFEVSLEVREAAILWIFLPHPKEASGDPLRDGLRRDLQVIGPCRVALLSERREHGPAGAQGGANGASGANILIRDGEERVLRGKDTFWIEAGDILSIRSPGGGGWGHTED